VDVIAGELSVLVFVHDVPVGPGTVPCWSYVTNGLLRHGQQEIVFTLRRRPGETATDFPNDPLDFFGVVHGLAREGKRVTAGDHTTFTPQRPFLGLEGPLGMAYMPAPSLDDVGYPARPLAAVLLLGDEASAPPVLGNYRVLSLLGAHCRYYPTPPWSDRDRMPVLSRTELEQSLLSQVPVVSLRGATVRGRARLDSTPSGMEGQDIRTEGDFLGGPVNLRLQEQDHHALRQALDRVQADAPLAILTAPDPRASVRLIWRPGQDSVQSIFPSGGDRAWATGGFTLFLAEASLEEGARVFEDGFAVQLKAATWAALRDALRSGRPWSLPAAGGLQGFTLEWDWPSRVRPVEGLFYQPDEVLRQRVVNQREFLDFLAGDVEGVVRGCLGELEPGPGQALTLVVAIRPGRRARYWLEFNPGGLTAAIPAELQRRLQELRPPEVRDGPVAYASHLLLWGGAGEGRGGFVFMPREWELVLTAGSAGVVPDAPLSKVWPE
jgi:hypothetical protein